MDKNTWPSTLLYTVYLHNYLFSFNVIFFFMLGNWNLSLKKHKMNFTQCSIDLQGETLIPKYVKLPLRTRKTACRRVVL